VAAKKKRAAAKPSESEPSPRVQALREILALRVKREPIPVELRDLDDMRFTSRRRVHAVLQAMHRDDAGMDEVEAYVAREIHG